MLNITRKRVGAFFFALTTVVGIISLPAVSVSAATPPPFTVDENGITLTDGSTFQDNGHVNIHASVPYASDLHFESKCAIRTDAECAGARHDAAQYIGKTNIPWSAFGLPETFCVTWVQISHLNPHFGVEFGTQFCMSPPTPPTDVCPNIDGAQEVIPAGMVKDDTGNCVTPPPPVEEKVCTGPGDITWTANANLSEATVTLKEGFTSCDVSLNSYETEGPTWETSGDQKFVEHDTVHLTAANPTGTLHVNVRGCYQQQDLYIGTIRYDGIDGALPHYPDSYTPENLLDHWNGGEACPPPAHETITPKMNWTSTQICDTTTYTVVVDHKIVLVANPAVIWTISKGDQSMVLDLGEGFNGLPPFGPGFYTATGSDGSSADLFDVISTTTEMTFVDPSTVACTPPEVPTQSVIGTDHSCLAVGTITIPDVDGVSHFVDRGEGKVPVEPGIQYATNDGTATGTPLFTTIKVYAEKSGKPNLSGTTYWEFVFTEPDCLVTAAFTPSPAVCIAPGVHSENVADLSGSDGVTFTYTLDGVDGGALAAGHYEGGDIESGTYDVTAHAPEGVFYHFEDGQQSLTFPSVKFTEVSTLDCMVTITKLPKAPTSSDVCGTSNDTYEKVSATDEYTVKVTDTRVNGVGDVVQQLIEVFGYEFPEGTKTSWTSTFTDEACPPVTPPVTPPVVVPPVTPPVVTPPVVVPPTVPTTPIVGVTSHTGTLPNTGVSTPILPIMGGAGALALGALFVWFGFIRPRRAATNQD